jgi:hypothetical protein
LLRRSVRSKQGKNHPVCPFSAQPAASAGISRHPVVLGGPCRRPERRARLTGSADCVCWDSMLLSCRYRSGRAGRGAVRVACYQLFTSHAIADFGKAWRIAIAAGSRSRRVPRPGGPALGRRAGQATVLRDVVERLRSNWSTACRSFPIIVLLFRIGMSFRVM